MIGDSDDVSAPHRAKTLERIILSSGCGIVGSNVAYFEAARVVALGVFPRSPSCALLQKFGHVMLYPSSIFRRDAFVEAGGFSDFESFGMDTEFVNKMCLRYGGANTRNILYAKREHSSALTALPETGFGSNRRSAINEFTREMWVSEVSQALHRF
jgi:hypothetical protein